MVECKPGWPNELPTGGPWKEPGLDGKLYEEVGSAI